MTRSWLVAMHGDTKFMGTGFQLSMDWFPLTNHVSQVSGVPIPQTIQIYTEREDRVWMDSQKSACASGDGFGAHPPSW